MSHGLTIWAYSIAMVRRLSGIFHPSTSSNVSSKTTWQSKPNFVFIDWVFVMGRWANVHAIHFDWGWGQMSNTIFESGDKCPPLLIIGGGGGGADVLIYHFHRGGGANVRGVKCPTLYISPKI